MLGLILLGHQHLDIVANRLCGVVAELKSIYYDTLAVYSIANIATCRWNGAPLISAMMKRATWETSADPAGGWCRSTHRQPLRVRDDL